MNISLEITNTPYVIDNYEQYSVKTLRKICDYYEITKLSKYKKIELIDLILEFENNDINNYIVCKRKIMWSFMEELNDDKKMKKYISWN